MKWQRLSRRRMSSNGDKRRKKRPRNDIYILNY